MSGGESLQLQRACPRPAGSGLTPEARPLTAVHQAGAERTAPGLGVCSCLSPALSAFAHRWSPFTRAVSLTLPGSSLPPPCSLPSSSLLSPPFLCHPSLSYLPPSLLCLMSTSPLPTPSSSFPISSISPLSARPRFGSRRLTFTRPFSAAVSTETSSGAQEGGDRRQTHPFLCLSSPSASSAPTGIPCFPSQGLGGGPEFNRNTGSQAPWPH